MSNDDQHFLDHLGRVSSDIRKFSADVLDASDRHIHDAATSLNEYLDAILPSSWVPRRPPIPAPPAVIRQSYLQQLQLWISRHRALAAALLAFVATGAVGGLVLYSQSSAQSRKRRAKRAKNGARKEVVGKLSAKYTAVCIPQSNTEQSSPGLQEHQL
jgi:hypothetical protein